ncbi:hypothetical protein H4582DRAFT_2052354 [Lactarius indigo]|nr:hypothetical protein H4582DRAFT_2052354 [Lactarius indigo]
MTHRLLSPPASAHTSLESLPKPSALTASATVAPYAMATGLFVSLPESLTSSPTKTNGMPLQFKVFINSRGLGGESSSEYVVEGVMAATVEKLLTEFEAYMGQIGEVGMWETLHKDFILGLERLIIRFPMARHEVITKLIHLAWRRAETDGLENSNIIWGASVNVPHRCGGKKTPDFDIFDRRRSNADVKLKRLNHSILTITFEITYSQTTQSLEIMAAQHICFTLGHILLVIAIDISRVRDSPTREIESVTWSHWEEDPHFHEELASGSQGDGADNVVACVGKLPPTYSATVCISKMDKQVKIGATQTECWKLYPHADTEEIKILQCHLFHGTSLKDVAFSFKKEEVMKEIFRSPDTKQALEDYNVTKERLKWFKSDL